MVSVQHECILKRCGHRPGDPAGKEGACVSLKVNPRVTALVFKSLI